jgi:hypothetical protein
VRYYYNKREDTTRSATARSGRSSAGQPGLKDTNLAASHTPHLRAERAQRVPLLVGAARPRLPRERPDEPDGDDQRPLHDRRPRNFPQSRVTDAYQFSNTLTWTKSRHTLKFGADVRYNKVDNGSAFNSKGTFTFNNLQDYMNNTAFDLQQALQTASWTRSSGRTTSTSRTTSASRRTSRSTWACATSCRPCRSACSGRPTPRASASACPGE